ncbi:DUF2523 family protein [Pseudomonas sp. UBA1879]|jgi:membrane-anchored glycerophosphoryl diester phosphodiesterase (GDPDase)|uniref:DUF2523 family protein n=1 Tax=Pseudomonas sp. UBA1879 TaxID=1947305 RepID=UPI0025EAB850|nr:DUF2523 family protein [Pseudomonas sp. UBA1879]
MFQVLFIAGQAILMWVLPRLLAAIGATAVSTAVILPIYEWLKFQVLQQLGSIGGDAANFIDFLGIPTAISIVFAAYALKVSIAGAKSAFSKKAAS